MLREIVSHTYKPLLKKYLANPRKYSYEGISIVVEPGVFHPAFFFSTRLLLESLKKLDLRNKKMLELGAGSGLIAIYAAKQGAVVTASDISEKAISNIKANAIINNVQVDILHSDLFDTIPLQRFDIIMINPPYFKKNPSNEADYAWYCGANGEYFSKLFSQLVEYTNSNSEVLIVLSSDCDMDMISRLAKANFFEMRLLVSKKKYWEENYIFQIRKTN